MNHPEYVYWAILVVLGVPALLVGRSPVPILVGVCSFGDAVFWRYWPSPQAEGFYLAILYGTMLIITARLRLDAAETVSVAIWSPMAFCALAQAIGAEPVSSYWIIYSLAIVQVLAFAFIRRWSYNTIHLIKRDIADRDFGGPHVCTV